MNYTLEAVTKGMLETWESTGLLDKLSEDNKLIVAKKLEETALYLMSEDVPKSIEEISSVAFPAIRRTLSEDMDLLIDIPSFLLELSQDYSKEKEKTNNFKSDKIDLEAEFLAKWCEKYVKNSKKQSKNKLNEELLRWKKLSGIL